MALFNELLCKLNAYCLCTKAVQDFNALQVGCCVAPMRGALL